eukprot:7387002-Pyramimonas_sp.AAC.1
MAKIRKRLPRITGLAAVARVGRALAQSPGGPAMLCEFKLLARLAPCSVPRQRWPSWAASCADENSH